MTEKRETGMFRVIRLLSPGFRETAERRPAAGRAQYRTVLTVRVNLDDSRHLPGFPVLVTVTATRSLPLDWTVFGTWKFS